MREEYNKLLYCNLRDSFIIMSVTVLDQVNIAICHFLPCNISVKSDYATF